MRTERQAGFTLIEMIIVVALIGILASAFTPFALASLRAYVQTQGEVAVLDKLRYATERLAREIREVAYDDLTGNFAFTTMDSGAIQFNRSYCDGSGCPSPSTTVTIATNGGSVTLAYASLAASGPQTLTDELGSLAFDYLDETGNAAGSASAVRAVRIRLTLSHAGRDYTQSTVVQLKNFSLL